MKAPEKQRGVIRIFSGGDIFGVSGMRCVLSLLPALIESEKIDFCIVNGENADSGSGITEKQAEKLFGCGVDVITGGNHSFEKRALWPVLDKFEPILRPGNFPCPPDEIPQEKKDLFTDTAPSLPGRGYITLEKMINGTPEKLCVINVQGREFMKPLDCPFRYTEKILEGLEGYPGIPVIVDFHGESNNEKEAYCLYFDGKISAVTGTHTHVQTGDARILEGGTACISDLGMCGPVRSVIGSNPEDSVQKALRQTFLQMREAEGPAALRGCIIDINRETSKAVSITTIDEKEF